MADKPQVGLRWSAPSIHSNNGAGSGASTARKAKTAGNLSPQEQRRQAFSAMKSNYLRIYNTPNDSTQHDRIEDLSPLSQQLKVLRNKEKKSFQDRVKITTLEQRIERLQTEKYKKERWGAIKGIIQNLATGTLNIEDASRILREQAEKEQQEDHFKRIIYRKYT